MRSGTVTFTVYGATLDEIHGRMIVALGALLGPLPAVLPRSTPNEVLGFVGWDTDIRLSPEVVNEHDRGVESWRAEITATFKDLP